MATLDCNQTNSFITLQQNYLWENAQAENSSACNVFDRLPNEVIQNCLAPYLTPNEALAMRLVNRRFAILFGDKHVWRIYYNIHGLKLPENNPVVANELTLSSQAKQFNFWRSFKEGMDEAIRLSPSSIIYHDDGEMSRSFFIKILAIPEFSLLHEYALQILRKHSLVPAELSVKEIMLRIAKKDKKLDVDDHTRELAICFIAKYAAEPEVKQILVSILTTQDPMLCEEQAKCIMPHIADPLVQESILMALRGRCLSTSIKILLDALFIENPKTLENPEVIELLIDKIDGNYEFYRFFHNHLSNPAIVKQLVQRLCNENNGFMGWRLILALAPIADQEFVQQAFCERLVKKSFIHSFYEPDIIEILSKIRLTNLVKEKYGHQIPELQEMISVQKKLNEAGHDQTEQRQLLFKALKSGNPFARNVAVNALARLVPFDPVIRETLLERIESQKSGKASAIISVLSTIACNKDIREIIIQVGLRSWEPGYSQQSLDAAVRALSPFAHKLDVRKAFIDVFKRLLDFHQELFDSLAVQLDKQDVLDLFLTKVIEEKGASPLRIAAIDKLGNVVSNPKVQTVLLQVYAENGYDVEAACIRALCSHSAIPVIHPAALIRNLNSSSRQVSLEAIRALRLWLS